MKNLAIILVALVIIGGAGFYFMSNRMSDTYTQPDMEDVDLDGVQTEEEPMPVESDEGIGGEEVEAGPTEVIGTSAGGSDITAYHFGEGEKEVLFVGGVHGGYSFNTALLGFELVDYFTENLNAVPNGLRVTVIPVLNPDGLDTVVGSTGRFSASRAPSSVEARIPGRFNADEVDINRNFDCEWTANATWQAQTVSGGDEPFSEPEARALRDYVESNGVDAAVVYFSQAGGVYASNCRNGVLPETTALVNTYAKASGYPAFEEFDYYEITGDMVNWMAKENVPAISVLLTDHKNTEWAKNKAGIDAVLEYLSK